MTNKILEEIKRKQEENKCIEEGCEERDMCAHCHRCQKHHDEQPDVIK